MRRFIRKERGITLTEALASLVIGVAVIFAVMRMVVPLRKYFAGTLVRQKAAAEARTCADQIQRVLANGRAGTLTISTPTTPPGAPPNSRAEFRGVDGRKYTIQWSASGPSIELIAGGTTTTLARNVTGLVFSGDSRDSAVVNFTVQIDVPVDSSGAEGRMYSIILPNQLVRMKTGS